MPSAATAAIISTVAKLMIMALEEYGITCNGALGPKESSSFRVLVFEALMQRNYCEAKPRCEGTAYQVLLVSRAAGR
ncbi:hypothetical protein Tco_0918780 [Tanacetum coccineum]